METNKLMVEVECIKRKIPSNKLGYKNQMF